MAPAAPKHKFFAELSPEEKLVLSALVDLEYEPDDCTDLQELAARAYMLGFRQAAAQFAQPRKRLII